MDANTYSEIIIREIGQVLGQVNTTALEELATAVRAANRVFVAGAGRSGLMAKAFAMRLMHMGFTVYVVGETVTPSLAAGDLLLLASGSGETGSLVTMADKCKKLQAKLAVLTASPGSTIGRSADIVVQVPAVTKEAADIRSITAQPMGSLFEQSILLLMDAIIVRLMELQEKTSTTMFSRHANLE
ncbi:6-phospho-3-hexuloisomerase [Propionispora vibrioides]|uniref:6-phospho-3-hexuloisomerase n=1 Tax=Propionispora vibrioides TaxID=112903 RepID=A0A1H8QWZ8_9FIRM|nr:6-phospho-3-hexuloisomerase [Propionispora vibrioides]SEO58695.1 6-phospho-3-hexuloisomerase [Propionispora vibrioides]